MMQTTSGARTGLPSHNLPGNFGIRVLENINHYISDFYRPKLQNDEDFAL